MQFQLGIDASQIWFKQTGNHLEVSIVGTNDKLIIRNWYLDSTFHIEQFKTADGLALLNHQIETIVNAMADFDPVGIGQTTLPANYATHLDPVISALWL